MGRKDLDRLRGHILIGNYGEYYPPRRQPVPSVLIDH